MTKLKVTTLGTAALCGTLLFSGLGNAFAEELPAGPIPANRTTDAIVNFVPDNSPTNPVNPETGEEVETVNPDGTTPGPGTNGPLSLDYASSLDFGTNVISTKDEVYNAKAQKLKDGSYVPNYAQVTDKRGTLKGWALSVKQMGQFKTSTNKELSGAEISFTNAAVHSKSESTKPGTVMPGFTLTPDGTGVVSNVVVAGEGQGAGTWTYRFGDSVNLQDAKGKDGTDLGYKVTDSITLSVPGKTEKLADSYKTELVWTLTDAPVNTDAPAGE